MNRYYFDFIHNSKLTQDREGTDHPDEQTARKEIHRTMLDVGRDAASPDAEWHLVGVIRDEGGEIWRGRLSFEPIGKSVLRETARVAPPDTYK